MECIFCKIISQEIPSDIVYEDEKSIAFLDIEPVAPGHLLLIPREHYQMMSDVPDVLLGEMFIAAKKIMSGLKKATEADFIALSVVGVDVPHFHIHLIPRRFDDGLSNFWPTREYDSGEKKEVLARIKKSLT